MRKNDTFDDHEEVRDFQLPDHEGPIPPDTKTQKLKGTWKGLNIWAKVGMILGIVLMLALCANVTGAAERSEERRESRAQEREQAQEERQAERDARQEEREATREERREEREEAWSDDAWGSEDEVEDFTTQDGLFFIGLAADNYTEWFDIYSEEQLILIGHSVCTDLRQQENFHNVVYDMQAAESDIHDASIPLVVGAAIASYCPEMEYLVTEQD